MLRLLRAEIYKLFRNRAFIILCIIALGFGILNFGMTKLVSSEDFIRSSLSNMSEEEKDVAIEQLKLATEVGTTEDTTIITPGRIGSTAQVKDIFNPKAKESFHSGFGQGTIEILLTILIAALVAKEYSSGTIKNMLAYGKKRRDYYLSKFLASSIGAVILLGITVFSNLILSSLVFPWGGAFDFYEFIYIVKIFGTALIVVMAMISLMMLLASILKSSGATIGIGISIFVLLPTVIAFLYGRYTWFDKIFESTVSYNYALATAAYSTNNDIIKAITISLITIIISLIAGISIFNKQDIK
ncbi:ABC transporter permease subunit [Clostridium sp. DL1XJH146]